MCLTVVLFIGKHGDISNGLCLQWATVSIAGNTSNQLYQYPLTCSVYCVLVSSYTSTTELAVNSNTFHVIYATSTSQSSTQSRIISTSYANNRTVRVIIIGKSSN